MGLADDLAIGAPIRPGVSTRILILDTERLPGITQQFWWGRGDLKHRFIRYEDTIRLPRVTIVCAKWHDQPDIIQLAEWDPGGRKKFLKNVHKLISSADTICGHFITGADIPWLCNDLYVEAGLPPLPPFRTIDTLKVIRKTMGVGAPFKSLDAFCQLIGVEGKTDSYDPRAMERAVTEKSIPDRQRLIDYCSGDVVATQALWQWLLKYDRNPPPLTVAGEDSMRICHRCGHDTKPTPRRYVANVLSYCMRKCVSCGAYSRISVEPERMSVVRSV
jgi:hypothetical protein